MGRLQWVWALAILLAGTTAWGEGKADIPVTGKAEPGLAGLDKMMLDFMEKQHVPGASLAVTRHGKLVYARGFGWADRETHEEAKPHSLFRIASVTKPFTSAAVMQLVEAGKLDLSHTHPFAELDFKTAATPGKKADPRLDKITLMELLQHRGGFDRDMSGDPMFASVEFAGLCGSQPPATQAEVIRVVKGRPLDFEPGARYAYSNFGYCVLGREIERASGQSYEEYVKEHVLAPIGITEMHLGRTQRKDKSRGEVEYYMAKPEMAGSVFPPMGRKVPWPYGGWCLESMDSHGGWIATAADVVKFASEFDDPKACRILKVKSITEIFARPPGRAGLEGQKADGPPADSWYGFGWSVRTAGPGGKLLNTWHNGGLAGTSTLMVRRWDGLDWAVLFNQDCNEKGEAFADLIDGLLHQAMDGIKEWPEGKGRDEKWP